MKRDVGGFALQVHPGDGLPVKPRDGHVEFGGLQGGPRARQDHLDRAGIALADSAVQILHQPNTLPHPAGGGRFT